MIANFLLFFVNYLSIQWDHLSKNINCIKIINHQNWFTFSFYIFYVFIQVLNLLIMYIVSHIILCRLPLQYIMFLTIVDTKTYGKFVLHKYPYSQFALPKQNISSTQLIDFLSKAFEYFGIYQKNQILSTSNGFLPEKAIVDLCSANQKYTQLVLGIDEDCILVSKSVILDSPMQYSNTLGQYSGLTNDLGSFISLNESQNSIINSISMVYRQDNFDKIENVKNKLAFLVGVLQSKQKHQKYLSKQIKQVMEAKQTFKKNFKDKCLVYSKQANSIYQQFKVKMIYKDIQGEADKAIKNIHLFQLIDKIYNAWNKPQFFRQEFFPHDSVLKSANGLIFQIPSPQQVKNQIRNIQNKCIITLPPKLKETLPQIFYPFKRVQHLYQRVISNNTKPLKKVLMGQCEFGKESAYHTIYFLLKNNLAVDVYPFDNEKYYCLYTLRQVPKKYFIQKFNYKIFPGQNLLQILKEFNGYKRIKQQDQKLKYLILQKTIKEVNVYIQKLEQRQYNQLGAGSQQKLNQGQKSNQQKTQINDSIMQNVMNKYCMKKVQLNSIVSQQKNIKATDIIKYVKNHQKEWKFYFVQ